MDIYKKETSMVGRNMTLLVFLISFSFLDQYSFAAAWRNSSVNKKAGDLVEEVCKTTVDPRLCITTLRSNPRSSSADVKGLGHIMLEATLAKSLDNFAQVNTLLRKPTDPVTKHCLESCSFQYDLLIDDVKQSIHNFESNDYFDASIQVAVADDGAETCESGFSELKRHSPLTERNKILEYLSRICVDIIARLDKS